MLPNEDTEDLPHFWSQGRIQGKYVSILKHFVWSSIYSKIFSSNFQLLWHAKFHLAILLIIVIWF